MLDLKTMVKMFCDETPLTEGELLFLVEKGLIRKVTSVHVAYELTEKGKKFL